MDTPVSRQPGANYAEKSPWHTKKGFRYARSSGDETLLGHLWPTDYQIPTSIINPRAVRVNIFIMTVHPKEAIRGNWDIQNDFK